jgi:hypothetical protein
VFGVMSETAVSIERRATSADRVDRRKNSRGGRRTSDPHNSWRWRRLAWFFAAYAVYLSARALPRTLKGYFSRKQTPAS